MMNNDRIEFAAKDIFVLLDVPTPNNLDVDNKWRIRNDSQNDENFSQFSSDSGKNVLFDVCNVFYFNTSFEKKFVFSNTPMY